jgi:hypothetical protein
VINKAAQNVEESVVDRTFVLNKLTYKVHDALVDLLLKATIVSQESKHGEICQRSKVKNYPGHEEHDPKHALPS